MDTENKELLETDKTKEYKDYKAKGRARRSNRFQRRGAKGVPTRGGNDFDFWNQYPELMKIATRFPWMHIAGTPLAGEGVQVNLPNVAVQHYFSVPSKGGSATDPINLAFRQIYLDMHRKYRGVGTYQASDIGIAMICIESVLQLIVELERMYGIMKGYPIKSRIEPEGLLRAMGYNPTFIVALKSGLADFRYNINRLISLARRLPLPSGMNFFRNHVALNGFTYKDSADERAGILVFVFDNYYRWQTTGDTGCINSASTALSVPFVRSTFNSPTQLVNLIEQELTKLLTDSDVLRITSDFISCYGEANMQVLTELPEDYTVSAQYSDSILHKWHNSERAGNGQLQGNAIISYIATPSTTTKLANGGFAVYQVNDLIMSLPVMSSDNTGAAWQDVGNNQFVFGASNECPYNEDECAIGHVADSWEAEPSEEHTCEAMLWRVCLYPRKNVNNNNLIANEFQFFGTEILGELDVVQVNQATIVNTEAIESSIYGHVTGNVDDILHFDWHPYILSVTGPTITAVYGDTDNVTVVSEDVIAKVIDAASLSAFKINISGGGARE